MSWIIYIFIHLVTIMVTWYLVAKLVTELCVQYSLNRHNFTIIN